MGSIVKIGGFMLYIAHTAMGAEARVLKRGCLVVLEQKNVGDEDGVGLLFPCIAVLLDFGASS
jgi:hypothetical protein